jgi:hypothetical protein
MAASVDERIVSMAFENAKFEKNIAQTMASLKKLDALIKSMNGTTGLENLEKAGNKVTLNQPVKALGKVKAEAANVGAGGADGLNKIEQAGEKVTLEQPVKALGKVKAETANVGKDAANSMNEIENASNKVQLDGIHKATGKASVFVRIFAECGSAGVGRHRYDSLHECPTGVRQDRGRKPNRHTVGDHQGHLERSEWIRISRAHGRERAWWHCG